MNEHELKILAMQNSIRRPVGTTHRDFLKQCTREQLQRIGKYCCADQAGLSRLSKQALIDLLCQTVSGEEWFLQFLYCVDNLALHAGTSLIGQELTLGQAIFMTGLVDWINTGLVFFIDEPGNPVKVVMPDDCQNRLLTLSDTIDNPQRERIQSAIRDLCGAIYLYAAVNREFLEAFWQRKYRQMTDWDKSTILQGYVSLSDDIGRMGDWLVDLDMIPDKKALQELLTARAGIDPWLPEDLDLSEYGVVHFIAPGTLHEELLKFFVDTLGMYDRAVRIMITNLAILMRRNTPLDLLLDTISHYGYAVPEEMVDDVSQILTKLLRKTRMPCYNGHTLEEIEMIKYSYV